MFSSMENGWMAKLGSTLASLMFLWAVMKQYFPYQLDQIFSKHISKIISRLYPYITIRFPEEMANTFKSSEAYTAIQSYLSSKCSSAARRLKADLDKRSNNLNLSMDDDEEVTDSFRGIKLWWSSRSVRVESRSFFYYPSSDKKRFYSLTFHRRHRELIQGEYLRHVLEQGKTNRLQNRRRMLYTNTNDKDYGYRKGSWSHVPFEHPATFDTIAMEPEKMEDIKQDLLAFSRGKEYYKTIGKVWKRGYLLYGPPGTGKSSMVAAIANFLDYDVYDLELTAVKDNTSLRKLLIETTNKAVIVIEDIDCSLDLTGQRKKKKAEQGEEKDGNDAKEEEEKKKKEGAETKESKVTLSGLLNFIDGLWSACGGEKVIVFTTNHMEKLDKALIRRGRMDKHIELSYCCFAAFKLLARNYLGVEEHAAFARVEELMAEVKISPADVAECLMYKGTKKEASVDACLADLVKTMEEMKKEGGGEAAAEPVGAD